MGKVSSYIFMILFFLILYTLFFNNFIIVNQKISSDQIPDFVFHDISIFQYLTDLFPEKVFSKGSAILQDNIYDSTLTQLIYPNGVEGHIFVSWLHPFKEHRLVVIGSEAMITFEDSSEGKPLKLYAKKFNMAQGIPEKIDGPVTLIEYEKKMALTEELLYFSNHLNNKIPKVANGQHALEVMKILIEASEQLENNENK